MRKFNCDICGLEVSQHNLTTLFNEYQPKDIEDACEDCYRAIRTVIGRIDDVMKPIKQSWVRRIILKRKAKHEKA